LTGGGLVTAGAPLEFARAAVILLHGRGADAPDILSLGAEFGYHDLALFAPQAHGNSWYPFSFLAPLAQNEPFLSQSLTKVGAAISEVGKHLPFERIVLLGFSQGGCLALEYAARNARRYGGVVGLSAGLIGPQDTPRSYDGSFEGTPVFLGCSDDDPHIPLWRVKESAHVLRASGAEVNEQIYSDLGHTINEHEIEAVNHILGKI
jgi:phospholipase/carboxylesterase